MRTYRGAGQIQSAEARADVEAAGVLVHEIADKAPFQNAMTVVYDEYLAANPDMKTLVELAQSTEQPPVHDTAGRPTRQTAVGRPFPGEPT